MQESELEQNLLQQNDDTHYDIVEFAQNFFNNHERTPEGKKKCTLYIENRTM